MKEEMVKAVRDEMETVDEIFAMNPGGMTAKQERAYQEMLRALVEVKITSAKFLTEFDK